MSTKVEVNSSNGSNFKLIAVLVLVLLGLGFYCYKLYQDNNVKADTITQLNQNVYALSDSITHKNVKIDGLTLQTANVKRLSLDRDAYKTLYKKEAETVKKLNIKLSNVSSTTNVSITTDVQVKEIPVYVEKDTAKFEFRDKWEYISATIIKNKADVTAQHKDSFLIVNSFKQKRYLFGLIKGKIKGYESTIVPYNPNTRVNGFSVKNILNGKLIE